jgi:squalene-hopene/tetraprenyl-beta-curcumene cyclase
MRFKPVLAILLACSFVGTSLAADETMDPKLREQARRAVDRGLHYLREQQAENGSLSKSVGITALALKAFLTSHRGYNETDGAFITRPLNFLVANAQPDGAISESLQNRAYNTATALAAVAATKNDKYAPILEKGRNFLKGHQIDESEGYDKSHRYYGGIGYGGDERPDMSNQFIALEAMRSAALDPKDPVWQKALTFICRSQNRSESNDQSWAGNDGGFVYMPGGNIPPFKGTDSYGGMTAAGLMTLLFAGADKNDPRVIAAHGWIKKNYAVDVNPGTGGRKDGIYYYYYAVAMAMSAMGEAEFVDGQGRKHNWRNELATQLLSLQAPDGSWVNKDSAMWWQDNPHLVTAWSVNALVNVLK